MKLATSTDLKEIMKGFAKYKSIFPHIRGDRIAIEINAGNVIYEDGVVVVFKVYKRQTQLGSVMIQPGEAKIAQIFNMNEDNGQAKLVMNKWISKVATTVYLTVRGDNERAIRFYELNGFSRVGRIAWKGGSVAGLIMKNKTRLPSPAVV